MPIAVAVLANSAVQHLPLQHLPFICHIFTEIALAVQKIDRSLICRSLKKPESDCVSAGQLDRFRYHFGPSSEFHEPEPLD